MNNTLHLFSRITQHLQSFTIIDDFDHSRSRGIATYEHLAEELNEKGILSSRGNHWTANSLECFLVRCRRKNTKAELAQCCDRSLTGATHYEYLSGERFLNSGGSRAPQSDLSF